MKNYIYIPKSYESQIKDNVDNYLLNEVFVVIKGIYKNSVLLDNSNNSVYNKTRLGEIQFIKNGFIDIFTNEIKELIGFCLEGNFQQEVPEIFEQISNLEDCFIFQSSTDYLDFEKIITQNIQ